MNSNKHLPLIIAASVVLLCSIAMQAWWMYSGYQQRKKNLTEQLQLAVKEAVNELNEDRDIAFIARMSREQSLAEAAELRAHAEELKAHHEQLAEEAKAMHREMRLINSSRISIVTSDSMTDLSLDSTIKAIEMESKSLVERDGGELIKFEIHNENGSIETNIEWEGNDSALFEVMQLERDGRLETLMQKIHNENQLQHHVSFLKLDSAELEVSVRKALNNLGLNQGFEFHVGGSDTALFRSFASANFDSNSSDIAVKTELLPFDLVSKDLTLEVQLNNSFGAVMNQLKWMVLASIVFSLAMIILFGLTVKRLLSQTRLARMKSDFINNMSHELKTPLATISIAADAILLDQNEMKRTEYVDAIKREQKRMHQHIERVLNAAQSESGQLEIHRTEVDLLSFFKSIENDWKLAVQHHNGKLNLVLPDEPILAKIDEQQMRIALNNLIDNALKYCDTQPEISLLVKSQQDSIFIEISDNGIGMNTEQLAMAFEPFYRATTGNLHQVKGFGLGLNFVKKVVEMHGGKIALKSSLGSGTSVKIYLPK